MKKVFHSISCILEPNFTIFSPRHSLFSTIPKIIDQIILEQLYRNPLHYLMIYDNNEDALNLRDMLIQHSSLTECCDCVSLNSVFITSMYCFRLILENCNLFVSSSFLLSYSLFNNLELDYLIFKLGQRN